MGLSSETIRPAIVALSVGVALERWNAPSIFGHEKIELLLQRELKAVRAVIEGSVGKETAAVVTLLDEAVGCHDEIARHMRSQYGTLDRDAFNVFRQYLYPTRSYPKGPSGAYSGNHAALRLLVFGPLAHRTEFFEESKPYFPLQDQETFQSAERSATHGVHLMQLLRDGTLQGEARVKAVQLVDTMIGEARAHLGAVINALKRSGESEGTGGQSVAREFLQQGIDALTAARRLLD